MRNRRAALPRFFLYLDALLLIGAVAAFGFTFGAIGRLHTLMPEQIRQRGLQPSLITEIYSTERYPDGQVSHTLLARVYKENREYTPLSEMPQNFIQATIDIEDRRFYQHIGISPRDIIRAGLINLTGHRVEQGASTLTQQLARNIWLSQERTWQRKIKEILLALELEHNFSKDEILEMYLNEVYYGRGAYGVKTAAQTYFHCAPKQMTLAQCALLAGLPKGPVSLDPLDHADQARARRAQVLNAMLLGGHIAYEQEKDSQHQPLVAKDARRLAPGVDILRAPYFTHMVIQQLTQWYGWRAVYRGGLRVYTSLDLNLQSEAQKDMDEWIGELRSSGQIHGGLVGQGALACVDVHDGRVLAMVGGVGPYDKLQYNRASPGPPQYGRQPGSSFKPYIWCTALESGFGPDSEFSGDPISLPLGNGKDWTPKNYRSDQGGDYSLREALAESVNLVSVRVLKEVTPDRAREYAAKIMNIPIERLSPYMALALGVSELSPLEQASGYATFASGGLRSDRTLIMQIDDYWGRAVYQAPLQPVRVIAPETANSMISMLSGVVEHGTGQRAQSVGFPAGGKTGTTQSGRDAWWVGFTPDLSAAVWVGNEDYSPMQDATGGGFCAPLWAKFMHQAMESIGYNGKFPPGSGVKATERVHKDKEIATKSVTINICADTGMRATPNCPHTYEKTFQPGEKIPGYCTLHGGASAASTKKPAATGKTVTVSICTESGMLAGPYCPSTEERTYPAGQQPKRVCTLHKGPKKHR